MPKETPLPKNLNPAELPALEQAVLRLVLRRGRVGAILNNYPYALGMILGSASVGTLILLQPFLAFSDIQLRAFALTIGLLAAVGGVTAMLWARAAYEDSLFSWHIRRRPRAREFLEKIDL